MIKVQGSGKKYSIPIKLIGSKCAKIAEFYLDTGFSEAMKIDRALFSELGVQQTRSGYLSLGDNRMAEGIVGVIQFVTDQLQGSCEIIGMGEGGRNLLGIKFFETANILLVIDYAGDGGIYLTSDRAVVYKVGKTLYEHHAK